MNYRVVARTLGTMSIIISCCMLPSAAIALYFNEERSLSALLLVSFMMFLFGWSLRTIEKKNEMVRLREGYLIVVLTWVIVCFFCALPYYISGAIPNFADALFESTSGVTTTGSSILTNIESLPASMLFWRAFTHWMGGLGILTMAIAILPAFGISGFQMAKAEASNSTLDKTSPKMSDMAKILYKTYFALTAICILLLMLGGMNFTDATAHAFSAISTGGFSNKNISVAYFDSAYIEAILAIFMTIGSISFPIIYATFVRKKFKAFIKHEEIKCFLIILLSGCLLVSLILHFSQFGTHNLLEDFRIGIFQTISVMTTTGFSTVDYALWPVGIIVILSVLMFMGGCSGSTTGGVKIIRILATLKLIEMEFKKKLHPKAIYSVKIKNELISYDTSITALTYVILFFVIALVGSVIVSFSYPEDFLTAFSASLASITNTGPGFGMVGPLFNFSFFPEWIKVFLSALMIIGKLEIFAVFMLFTPSFWNPDKYR